MRVHRLERQVAMPHAPFGEGIPPDENGGLLTPQHSASKTALKVR